MSRRAFDDPQHRTVGVADDSAVQTQVGGLALRIVAAAPSARWVASSSASSSGVSSGVSPDSTSTSPAYPASAGPAARAASPVPSGSCCTATVTSRSANASRPEGEATTTTGSAPVASALPITQSTRRRPRIGWKCLGTDERIRVPRPPAMIRAASGGSGMSSSRQRDGWGARIRTWDRGTKTRCLTTWLRPTAARV